MTTFGYTSVPPWTLAPHVDDVDPTGREYRIVGVTTTGLDGGTTDDVCARWQAALTALAPHKACRTSSFDDPHAAVDRIREDAATVTVGSRLLVAGTATDCALLRAAALDVGWTDEEIRIGAVDVGLRAVSCTHCGATTLADVEIDAVTDCGGCGRSLLVYHHFSRRTGSYLGYQVDAEDGPA